MRQMNSCNDGSNAASYMRDLVQMYPSWRWGWKPPWPYSHSTRYGRGGSP